MTINRCRSVALRFASIASAILLCASASNAQSIGVPRGGDPTTGILGSIPTVGQTFTVPTGYSFLQSFSLWLSNDPTLTFNAGEIMFRAYIAPWTGTAAGAPLYQSAIFTGVNSQAYPGANSLNLSVTPGTQYVAFVSSTGLPSNPDAYAAIETSAESYAGGAFVFTDGSYLDPWFENGSSALGSVQFSASFSTSAITTVPEPSTMALLVLGIGIMFGMTLAARMRKTALD